MAIAALGLRRLLVRPTDLFFVIALPLLITLVIGFSVFGSVGSGYRVGIVDESGGARAAGLVRDLERSPAIAAHPYADADELRKAVRRGFVVAGVIVPSGYEGAGPADVIFVADPARSAPAGVRSTVVAAIQSQDGRPKVGVDAETVATARSIPGGFSYPATANIVLFMFITAMAGSAALIEQRVLGLTRRMLATPTSVASIVAGQAGSRLAIALFQGFFILVVGALAFGVNYGDLGAAIVLVAVFGLVATSVSTLAGSLFRTAEQARAIAPPLGIALGMLGGCMWPLEIVGSTMRSIGHVVPHAWAMDAFVALTAKGADLAGIAPQLLVLLGYTAVLLPVATWRLRAALVR
jgi:ABC-2 type transport system permease protein